MDMLAEPRTPGRAAMDPRANRLQHEWKMLLDLVQRNPMRLVDASRRDTEIFLTLVGTPARMLCDDASTEPDQWCTEHQLRILFPRFYPSMPMEAYLGRPVLHPNVHPETGFICLWNHHRVQNTVLHAVHKTVAILGWQLMNTTAIHVMQPPAANLPNAEVANLRARLYADPLVGAEIVAGEHGGLLAERRRRLF